MKNSYNTNKANALSTSIDPKILENAKQLTKREKEVLNNIGNRYSTKEIAMLLGLSPSTIETHRKNIRRKLKLKTKDKLFELSFLLNLNKQDNLF